MIEYAMSDLKGEEGIDYKAVDTQKIVDYINSFTDEVQVEDVVLNSGADRLRVYPALFELEQEGWLEVVEREELGAPTSVRRRKDSSANFLGFADIQNKQNDMKL